MTPRRRGAGGRSGARLAAEDDAEAAGWYRLAADQGLAGRLAQHEAASAGCTPVFLGMNGEGVPEDDAEAAGCGWPPIRGCGLVPDQGHAGAQYNLGLTVPASGEGVVEDDAEAARRYRLAADQGSPEPSTTSADVRQRRGCAGR